MFHRSIRHARRLFLLSAALFGAAAMAPAAAKNLRFEQAFATAGEPAAIHYQVLYRTGNSVHHLDIQRDGDQRIRRSTDRALISYAAHKPGDPAYQLVVLDTVKKISTKINRTNLYREGNFSDWFDLGHGLRHPRGNYTLSPGNAPGPMPRIPGSCSWYDLTQQGHNTQICWDRQNRIPLLIVSEGLLAWRVTAIDLHPIPPAEFVIHDRGYVHDDADQDIEGD